MNINLNNLISFEEMISNLDKVLKKVDNSGEVIILKDNKPQYVLMKFTQTQVNTNQLERDSQLPNYTLQEAMKIVLVDVELNQMHAADLADEIYERKLYFKKDGSKAEYNQIRARCNNYKDMFEGLPGNVIRLKNL